MFGRYNFDSIIKEPLPTPKVSQSSAKKQSSKFSKMNYDDILEELGELGRWQLLHLSLLWLPAMAGGIFVLTWSFTGKWKSYGYIIDIEVTLRWQFGDTLVTLWWHWGTLGFLAKISFTPLLYHPGRCLGCLHCCMNHLRIL